MPGRAPAARSRASRPGRWPPGAGPDSRLSRSDSPFSASRVLKNPTGMTRVPGRPTAGALRELVISSRPARPSGHSPVRSAVSGRSSRTTSQGCLVSPSQLTKRTATESAVPVGSRPVAATDACTSPDRTAARLVTEIQISPSMTRDRHNDSAIIAASWVLPPAPGQFGRVSGTAGSGTSATAEPGTRTSARPRAVSGRSVEPSASGGTSPIRNRRACSAGIPIGHHRPPPLSMLLSLGPPPNN